jgi:hypothetical protein
MIRFRVMFICTLYVAMFSTLNINLEHTIGKVWLIWFIVFNATFNNISDISWPSVLLVKETGVPEENHRPVASH